MKYVGDGDFAEPATVSSDAEVHVLSSNVVHVQSKRTCSSATELFRAKKIKFFTAFPCGPNPLWRRARSQSVCLLSCCGVGLCVDISSRAYVHKACQTALESRTVAAQGGRPLGPRGFFCRWKSAASSKDDQNLAGIKERWAAWSFPSQHGCLTLRIWENVCNAWYDESALTFVSHIVFLIMNFSAVSLPPPPPILT